MRVDKSSDINRRLTLGIVLLVSVILSSAIAKAGPPYVTDDPEPVELHHWEIYFAFTGFHDSNGWTGDAPQIEFDYGALPNTQLSLIVPMAFNASSHQSIQGGYGDTELSVKYRFVSETDWLPQIAVFPQINPPTGSYSHGLGTGQTDAYFPVWCQKSFGKWTLSGGGGYWINPGPGNQNWWYSGILLQRTISDHLMIGTEIFHETSSGQGAPANTSFNVGAVLELNDRWDVLFSAGRSIAGPGDFQGYFAFRLKLGPEKEK
jgi:hypothetical protein